MHNAETPASIKYGFYSDNNITSANDIAVGGKLNFNDKIFLSGSDKTFKFTRADSTWWTGITPGDNLGHNHDVNRFVRGYGWSGEWT